MSSRTDVQPAPRRGLLLAAVVLVLTAVLSALALSLGPSGAEGVAGPGDGLPDGSGSRAVAEQLAGRADDRSPLLVVVSRDDRGALTAADRAQVERAAGPLSAAVPGAPPLPPQVEPSGRVATLALPLPAGTDDEGAAELVAAVRAAAADVLPSPLRAEVTGAPAFSADLSAVFDGADVRLLATTAAVVAVLLLVTYRSPVLWLVPLAVVGLGDRLAAVLVGAVAPRLDLVVDPSTAGILSVLVFGAGTDYALLLVSRYRDELRREAARTAAMARALRATAPVVLASGGTVALGLLTLLAASLPTNRGLGAACALGITVAVLFGLVVLPAALVLPGRWLFWPLVPRVGDALTVDRSRGWARLGHGVARRPLPVAAAGLAALVLLTLPVAAVEVGLSQDEQFREVPEAVRGAQTLASVLPAGASSPLVVLSPAAAQPQVERAARRVEGVADVTARVTDGRAVTTVTLEAAPGTERSDEAIAALRSALDGVPAAAVGGETAERYDVDRAYARDVRVVVPLVLAVVLVVLVALLRSLLAPLLLVAVTVLSYGAALGAGWLLFRGLLDLPALDSSVPLLSFLFLVALGVDYTIFLVGRTREDVLAGHPTRSAVVRALTATGGVITSAGVLLAAVFAVLGVLPLITLTQIGVVVGLGVLLDTLLVRTVVVPAIVLALGERFWWPGRPGPADDPGSAVDLHGRGATSGQRTGNGPLSG